MSAKKMFEELGFEQDLNNKFYIGYCKQNKNKGARMFTFMKEDKYFTFVDKDNHVCITFDELQAINKQVEELGQK